MCEICVGLTKKQNLAGAGFITSVNQFLGQIVSIGESLSYNSEEKTNIMALDIGKKAVSTSVLAGGYALGGPIGAAVGLIVNKMLIDPAYSMGRINISRNLDETRATNRFYQTNFAGKGNYTFNYSLGSYTNEDLEKVRKGSFYKRGRYI